MQFEIFPAKVLVKKHKTKAEKIDGSSDPLKILKRFPIFRQFTWIVDTPDDKNGFIGYMLQKGGKTHDDWFCDKLKINKNQIKHFFRFIFTADDPAFRMTGMKVNFFRAFFLA